VIVLFDANAYDKLIDLPDEILRAILDKLRKIILPQAVRKQLDMMINSSDKLEKLSKINLLISDLDAAGKIDYIHGMFGFASYEDLENGKIKKDKKTQRKYYSIAGFSNYENFGQNSLGMNTYGKQSYFDSLPSRMKNGDKQIALTAKQEDAIVITEETKKNGFYEGLKKINQPVMNFEEFLIFLQISVSR
jgi:hypothetical protein